MSSFTTLSTGQTVEDLVQLARLRDILGAPDGRPEDWLPPALTDSDYFPPQRLRNVNLYTGTIFLSINALLVGWKIFTTQRTRSTKLLFLEDWLLLLALTGSLGYMVIVWLGSQSQVGWHIYDIRYHNLLKLYKLVGISNLFLIWTYCTSRASLLVSVRRMYSPLKTRITILIDILIIGKVFLLIINSLAMVFASPQHPDAAFNLETALRYRINILETDRRLIAAQVAIDTIVLLSPVPLLWKLKMLPDKRRWQILALCAMGVSTMIAAYTRLGLIMSLQNVIFYDFSWYLPVLGLSNIVETFLALITACVPTANLFFKWAYNKPRIPAASPRRRRTIRKYKKKRDPNGTVDTVDTGTTVDSFSNYDADWSKGDTMHSDWSRADSMRPLRPTQTLPDDLTKPIEVYKTNPAGIENETPPDRIGEPLKLSHSPELTKARSHSEMSNPARKSVVSLREADDEEEDNFYEMLIPSDGFFPFGSGLRPRPPARPPSESHEMRAV